MNGRAYQRKRLAKERILAITGITGSHPIKALSTLYEGHIQAHIKAFSDKPAQSAHLAKDVGTLARD